MNKYVNIEKLEENEPLPDAEITWIEIETIYLEKGELVVLARISYEALKTQYLKAIPIKECLKLLEKII